MIKLTAKKIVGSVIAVLVVFAALFTVVDTPLNWWRLINGNEIDFGRLFFKQSETTPQGPTVAARLTPTATPARYREGNAEDGSVGPVALGTGQSFADRREYWRGRVGLRNIYHSRTVHSRFNQACRNINVRGTVRGSGWFV